jgi:hypothetical protein
LLSNVFCPPIYNFSNSIKIKYFRLHLNHSCTSSLHNRYSIRCSFINIDSSVVPDALIGLPLNLETRCSRRSSRTLIIVKTRPPSFESFHPFVNFLLAHRVIAILNCHYT